MSKPNEVEERREDWPVEQIKDANNLNVADKNVLIRTCKSPDTYGDGVLQKPGTTRAREKMNFGIIIRGTPFDVGGVTIGIDDAVVFGGHALTSVSGIGGRDDEDRIGLLLKDDVLGAMVQPKKG